ncbi:dipeptide/oligopeptide/nickel ABC transporter permease/ATP-binding protein [Microbacterium sp. B2969]|uniref:Nickel import system ATP-binding protein NikD n=1 Tax=Microbacterium alkaliflavum TaxID=3248839 RepID=A0ABW7Q5V0_9MICO
MSAAPDATALVTNLAPRAKSRPAIVGVMKNPIGAVCAVYLGIIVLVGVFAPLLAPMDPNFTELAKTNAPPFTGGYILGGDGAGRDILSRIVYGARETLIGCVLVLGVSLILGVIAGLVAGYYRGNAERVIDFISDAIMTLPGIAFLIALYARVGPNMPLAMMVFGVIIAPTFFRLVRAVVVTVRRELYVDAARVVGLSDLRIVGRHVLWAVRGPVIIHSAGILAAGIGIQAGLAFIGLGNPAVPSWGRVLQEAFENIYRNPAGVVWPAVVISVSILAFVLLGNVLRDVLQAAGSAHALRPSRRRILAREAQAAAVVGVAPSDDVVLSIRGLRMGYPDGPDSVREVLHGVDLDLQRGEIHGLVGESGSGKSQIAFSILGILPKEAVPLGGSIVTDGVDLLRDRAGLREARGRRIGYIPQEPMSNLDPSFTIGDQLVYGLRAVRKMPKKAARDRVRSLLIRVGIADADRVMSLYPHEISGGMAQRVLICGAIAPDPDILVADEPTTALDVTVQAEVLELLRELSVERGLAMVLVTHNLGVVADLCATVSVMKDGHIVERGTVEKILGAPENPYTQELLTSSQSVELMEVGG